MYSILPAVVSALFLGYGLYVVAEKGFNRVSSSFLALCLTAFLWQASWGALFQLQDETLVSWVARLGYLPVLFLPTLLYHFVAEAGNHRTETPWIQRAYLLALALAALDLGTSWVINGTHRYGWGHYPRAGVLHPLHVLQTVAVLGRALYLSWHAASAAVGQQRQRQRLCLASLVLCACVSLDYVCSYGVSFYPPGAAFAAVGLGLIAFAVTRYELMGPARATAHLAATVAHEMRSPLATIRMQADAASNLLKSVKRIHEVQQERAALAGSAGSTDQALALIKGVAQQVDRAQVVIDMLLSFSRMDQIDPRQFGLISMKACLEKAVASYPFCAGDFQHVKLKSVSDFRFHGSEPLMTQVIFNLVKNGLHAIRTAGKGEVTLEAEAGTRHHTVRITDTGSGISPAALPYIFQAFYTTKTSAGAGIGLTFCQRVIETFGGTIRCESVEGQYTTFIIELPALAHLATPPQPQRPQVIPAAPESAPVQA